MRGRGAVLGLVLGAASSLVVGGVAVAAEGAVAASVSLEASASLEAPVGIAAVAFGAIGLVAGLVRRRRAAVVRAASEAAGASAVVGDPVEVRPATTGV